MPTREQITYERLNALIEELGENGIIDESESDGLTRTRHLDEAQAVKESSPEPPAVTRSKVSRASREEFVTARDDGEIQKQLDILFEIVSGEHPDEV